MTEKNIAKFFGMEDESARLSYIRVVNTLERILADNDRRRFDHLKKEIMPMLLTHCPPAKEWTSSAHIYREYAAGRVDDVVSRAVEDVENHFSNKRWKPSFFNGGLTYNLLHSRRITRHFLFSVMFKAVEGLKCEPGKTLTKEQTEERIETLVKTFRPMDDQDMVPDSISGWLINATPWYTEKMRKEGITKDYLREMIRDELLHFYKYNIYLNAGSLDRLNIRHFDYCIGALPLGQEFSMGRVGLLYYVGGSNDSLVKIWNGDPLYANTWKLELEVADYMSDKKVSGIVPMVKVAVEDRDTIVDGIRMPRVDGVSLSTFKRMKERAPKNVYLPKDMESAVAGIIEDASSYGLHPVDVNVNNVIVRKLFEGISEDHGEVVIYGEPTVIDPGSWVTEARMRQMIKDPPNKTIVQMQTRKLQEINDVVSAGIYRG